MPRTLAVLAGDRSPDALLGGAVNKSLLPVRGRTSLEWVLTAAERAGSFRAVVVVGPQELDQAITAAHLGIPIRRTDPGASLVENIERAFAAAQIEASDRLFLATADIPLVTSSELGRFADLVERSPADACIAVARPLCSEQRRLALVHYRRSMIIARGGPYLLGNLFAIRRRVLDAADIIVRGRRVRRQSKVSDITRAFATFVALGGRAWPALATWGRLVLARALWLWRGDAEWIPGIAPSVEHICAAAMTLVGNDISVAFVEAGADGACYDIDDRAQYEAMQQGSQEVLRSPCPARSG